MNTLRPSEKARYASLKAEIRAGLMGVARALMEVRDGKLYVEEYSSFAEFVEFECGFSRARAYQLIDSAKGELKLLEAPTKVGADDDKAPTKVGANVARAVAAVPQEHVAAVIEAATEGGTKPATAASVKRVTAEIVTPDVTPDVTPKSDDTPAAKFRKLRSVAKQHNAAMIRAIDSMNDLILNPGTHRKLVQHYEAIDNLLEGWPV
jgi:hypothetical protein